MNKKQAIVFSVLIILGVFAFVFFLRKIVIKNISCKSQYSYCGDYLDKKLSKVGEKDYWTTKRELKKLLDSEGIVQKYNILYRPLDGILINVVIRKGIAAIKTGSMYYIFDRNGFIISEIFTDKVKYNVGDKIDDKLLFYSDLVVGANKMFSVEKASVDENGNLEIKLRNGPLVLFPEEGDGDILLGSLRLIINQLKKDMNTTTLDLRYKNPIIKR